MEEVMFVIKCLLVTVVVVVCLQIRVGGQTVEGHAMGWVHHSAVSHTLQEVAEGAVKVGKQTKSIVLNLVGSHDLPEMPSASTEASTGASTGSWMKIKRSPAYYRQKEREEKRRVEREREEDRAMSGSSDSEFSGNE